MKRMMKMLGLAAVAAMAAMAFIGASSASADSACGADEEPECASPLNNQTVEAFSPEAVLSGGLSVTCESNVVGNTGESNGAGEGLTGSITSLTFSNCEGGCATADGNGEPYTLTAFATTNKASVTTGGGGNPRATLTGCLGFATCIYGAEEVELDLNEEAQLFEANEEPLQRQPGSSIFCPSNGTWDADYEVESPSPLYLSQEP